AKLRAEAARAANSSSKRLLSDALALTKASVGKRKSLMSMTECLSPMSIATTGDARVLVSWMDQCHRLVRCTQTISDSCFGEDIVWTFGIRLDLLPELPNVYTKILRVRQVIPQFPQQESVRAHLAGMLNKHAQEFVLLGRQLHLRVAYLDDAPYQIDRQIANAKNWTLSLNVELMTKCGAHPGKQFIHAEGLRHIVVSSEIERLDFAGLIATARQNHDWYALVARADHPQQIEALDVRQSEIKNDQI